MVFGGVYRLNGWGGSRKWKTDVTDLGGVSESACHEYGTVGVSRIWEAVGFARRGVERRELVLFIALQ